VVGLLGHSLWPRTVASGLRPRIALGLLVLAVALAHWGLTQLIIDSWSAFGADQAMPARLDVVYRSELEPTAPAAATKAAPPDRAGAIAAPSPQAASAPRLAAALAESNTLQSQDTSQAAFANGALSPSEPPAGAANSASSPKLDQGEAASASQAIVEAATQPPPEAPRADVAAERTASVAPAFEWPGSTRLRYSLTGNYRGPVTGDAQVEWVHAGSRYQVHLDFTIGLSVAPLVQRRMTSDGQITADGLVPQRYDEETRALFGERRRRSLAFAPGAVTMPDGSRRESFAGVQDSASQFVQLSYLFTIHPEALRTGSVIRMPLALPRSVDQWVFDVLGSEVLQTPFGALEAFHVRPRRLAQSRGELYAEIWFAPNLRYLPVRIRIQQDESTFVDLMLAHRPELAAAPVSAPVPADASASSARIVP